MARLVALGEGTRNLEAVDHPHRTVEPAASRLGVGMGADEEGRTGIARTAEHRPDPVDSGVESRRAHSAAEPVTRVDVDRGQRLPHDPDAAGAEFAEPPEIGEQSIGVDLDVDGGRRAVHLRSSSTMSGIPLCRRGTRCQSCAVPERPAGSLNPGAIRVERRIGVPRLFVGLELPEALTQAVGDLQFGLRDARWLDPDALHLTLAFIGAVDRSAQARIEVSLRRGRSAGARGRAPRNRTLPAPGSTPRAVGRGISGPKSSDALAASVRSALARAGHPPERRKFAPHVTIARLRRPPPPPALQDYLGMHSLFQDPRRRGRIVPAPLEPAPSVRRPVHDRGRLSRWPGYLRRPHDRRCRARPWPPSPESPSAGSSTVRVRSADPRNRITIRRGQSALRPTGSRTAPPGTSMPSSTFDALTAARKLEAAGIERAQAEAIADQLRTAAGADLDQLATRGDLAELRAELRAEAHDALGNQPPRRPHARRRRATVRYRLTFAGRAVGGRLGGSDYNRTCPGAARTLRRRYGIELAGRKDST